MSRGRIDLAITLALLGVLLAAAATGVLAEALGVERSVFHRVFAYVLFLLGCTHAFLRRRQLAMRLRRAFGRRPSTGIQAEPGGALQPRLALPSRRSFIVGATAAAAGFVARPWLLPYRPISATDESDLGLLYHRWSKPSFTGILTKPFSWGAQPPLYREYRGARRLSLPSAAERGDMTVEEAIESRRSMRDYSGAPLTLDQLACILYAASGITEQRESLRASPSAGAQYPLEVYVVAHNVSGLAPGVYHYRPADHALDALREGDLRVASLAASGGQDMAGSAGAVLVVTAVFQRTRWRYRDRAYRYVLLDAGHLGENVYLQATSLGLGVCGMGAFLDDDVNALIGVDGEDEAALYLLSLGSVQ